MLNSLRPFDVLNRTEIAAVLENLSQASVAVLGDFCLDVYWTVDRSTSEASLETGLMTEPVRQQRYSPGGAGNVVMNLLSLGVPRIFPMGILGNDPFGRELQRLLQHPHIDTVGLITQSEDWATHAYVKPHVDAEELNRLDHGNFNCLSQETEDVFFAKLESILAHVSVVLINHQVIGSIHDSAAFRERLANVIQQHRDVCFIVDSRGYHESYAKAVHKLNDREVMRACGKTVAMDEIVPLDDLENNARALQKRWGAPLIVTRGERGCLVFEGNLAQQIFGIQVMGKTDPVGAGDTFVSALAAVVSTGTNITATAFVANIAAAVTAQKLFQTGTATPDEILEMGSNVDFVYRPELAESPHRARFFEQSEIEIIAESTTQIDIKHAIFDHDGTISTLREGWEQIMEPMMMKAVLGAHYDSADEALFLKIRDRVRIFIEKTTGIQTIVQMHGLVELVREFHLVPEKDILDAVGYKAIYNVELKELVNRRLGKLDRGELDISDFTIKGAVEFLETLKRTGVKLYLASGTDDEDVKFEATRLGYASLFDGGIFGSVGHIAKDAKKVVLERIMTEVGGAFGQLISFGDGPVEMRETVKRGGYAVGIASDETRRFGYNAEKRSRLIRSGAHAIIPDFSQGDILRSFLRIPPLS